MKTTKNPHLERNQHPLSKFVWSNESTVIKYAINYSKLFKLVGYFTRGISVFCKNFYKFLCDRLLRRDSRI